MSREKVVVIGGGVGGYASALRAARLGAEVTLVEKDRVGGVCLNRGCIPTKVFLHSASIYREMQRSSLFGLKAEHLEIDFGKVQARKASIVERLTGGVRSLLKNRKIRVVAGTAAFADARSVTILETGEVLPGDKFIVATGSVPARVPIEGSEAVPILTSDELLELEAIPASLIMVGGGYIGVELGQFFSRMGAEVSIVEMQERIVPTEDEEISRALEGALAREGIRVLTRAAVRKIEPDGKNKKITVSTPDGERELGAAEVAQAVGRRPSTAGLNVEKIGLDTEKGRIAVNERMQTGIPHIYAVGDAVGGIMLAHVAIAEAECAAHNALGIPSAISYKAVPRCIYTSPEVACVGLSEKKAREEFGEVRVGRFPLQAVGKALLMEEAEGMIKIVASEKYGEILGVHIIGPHATELIAEAVLALEMEATAEELAHAIHPHPTVSEGIGEAAMLLAGGAVHLP